MTNDFQALYMSELKLEVMHVFLNLEIYTIDCPLKNVTEE